MPRNRSRDQLVPRERLARRVPLVACDLVQPLRVCLREPVGERPHHDRPVVVMFGSEALCERLTAVDCHNERADVVGETGVGRRDVVGQRAVGAGVLVVRLLAQHGEAHAAVEHDVVLLRARRPEAVDGPRREQPAGDDLVEQRVRRREEVARGLALDGVVEDRGVAALELPGVEEERPVDVAAQDRDRLVRSDASP